MYLFVYLHFDWPVCIEAICYSGLIWLVSLETVSLLCAIIILYMPKSMKISWQVKKFFIQGLDFDRSIYLPATCCIIQVVVRYKRCQQINSLGRKGRVQNFGSIAQNFDPAPYADHLYIYFKGFSKLLSGNLLAN